MARDMYNCKENNDQAAAGIGQAAARDLIPQQAACTATHNTQVLAVPVPAAASILEQTAGQPPLQDSISTQAHAPVPEAHLVDNGQAVSPTDQAVGPQADVQVSLPPVDLSSQADLSNSAFHGPSGPAVHATPNSAVQGSPDASCQLAKPSAAPAVSQQPGSGAQAAVQQASGNDVKADEVMLQAGTLDATVHISDNRQSLCEQSAAQSSVEPAESSEQQLIQHQQRSGETATKTAANEADPGNASAEQGALVRADVEADAPMEVVDNRSAADIFEQTVIDCKSLLSETSSILLNKESQDVSAARTSRIAASERATMWHNELQGLLKRCKIPQLYIGVLGDTGMHLFYCQSGQTSHNWQACLTVPYALQSLHCCLSVHMNLIDNSLL